MGLVICKFKDTEDLEFLVYDKKEFNPEDFGMEKVRDTTLEESSDVAIINLNEFLLRNIYPKQRTDTHILGELGLETFDQIKAEKGLIDKKKSKLSKSQRDVVVRRYNDLISLT